MEEDTYILWSARSSGWMTPGATISSQRSEAEVFTYTQAIARCKIHKGNRAEYGLIPVSLTLLKAI